MSVRAVMVSTTSGIAEYVWSMTARERLQHLESEGAWGLRLRGPYLEQHNTLGSIFGPLFES